MTECLFRLSKPASDFKQDVDSVKCVFPFVFAVLAVLLTLIIYPICFHGELEDGNRPVWEFGWAYGVGWGAAIFLFGGVILLLCDKESEEIYVKERVMSHDAKFPPPGS